MYLYTVLPVASYMPNLVPLWPKKKTNFWNLGTKVKIQHMKAKWVHDGKTNFGT